MKDGHLAAFEPIDWANLGSGDRRSQDPSLLNRLKRYTAGHAVCRMPRVKGTGRRQPGRPAVTGLGGQTVQLDCCPARTGQDRIDARIERAGSSRLEIAWRRGAEAEGCGQIGCRIPA